MEGRKRKDEDKEVHWTMQAVLENFEVARKGGRYRKLETKYMKEMIKQNEQWKEIRRYKRKERQRKGKERKVVWEKTFEETYLKDIKEKNMNRGK